MLIAQSSNKDDPANNFWVAAAGVSTSALFIRTVMVFSKPRYPRYAIDLSHPAIRYAIASAITVSGRYFSK